MKYNQISKPITESMRIKLSHPPSLSPFTILMRPSQACAAGSYGPYSYMRMPVNSESNIVKVQAAIHWVISNVAL